MNLQIRTRFSHRDAAGIACRLGVNTPGNVGGPVNRVGVR